LTLSNFYLLQTAAALYPAIDVSEVTLLPPMQIVARSDDQKLYKVLVSHPLGELTILVKDSTLTPKQDGSFVVLKADAIDVLQ
jgi:hypothetical protein